MKTEEVVYKGKSYGRRLVYFVRMYIPLEKDDNREDIPYEEAMQMAKLDLEQTADGSAAETLMNAEPEFLQEEEKKLL